MDTVQQIKERLDIVEVVGSYVELHKAGRHFKGKSPFSNERTPSFYVSPDRGMYYCFSTNQGGDIFTFIQNMEGVTFKEALHILGEKAGVEIVKENPEKKTQRDRYYEILTLATDFFATKLQETPEALQYLKDRGVEERIISEWQIGYAPGPPLGGWRELRSYLNEKGFSDEELLAVGIIKKTEQGKDPFDVFRDRIVFPMRDTQGRVVAFSGRILHPSDAAPKYLNSPETELYKKSELLYGFDKAKHSLKKMPFWIIAEGQFDVVMSHQAGYTTTVAVSGTALTEYQVKTLLRLSEKVVLALDSDRAGLQAMQKGAKVMLAHGMDVKVATLPEGKDPADIIKDSKAEFKRYISSSQHVIETMLEVLQKEARDDRTYKLQAREEVLPLVAVIPNEMERDHFVSLVAEKTETGVDAVRHELQRFIESQEESREKTAVVQQEAEKEVKENTTDRYNRQRDLKTYLLAAQAVVPTAWQAVLQSYLEDILEDSLEILKTQVDETKFQEYTFLIEEEFSKASDRTGAEELADRLNQLARYEYDRKLQHYREKLVEAEMSGDEAKQTQHLQELQSLQKKYEGPLVDSNTFLSCQH